MNGDNVSAIILDLDGVLVDFVSGIARAHGVDDPYSNPENLGKYGIDEVLGIPADEFWKPCDKHDFWADLPWMDDGRAILSFCERAVAPGNVYLYTSPTRGPYSRSGKTAWVVRNLPEYERLLQIGAGKHLAARPDHLLVDDSEAVVDLFRACGGQAILVPRKWNKRYREAHAAAGIVWRELHERI